MSGVTWSQFEQMLERLYQQDTEPSYSIQSLTAEGRVVGNMANLTLQLRIQTKNEPVVRIPIGLKSGIFTYEPDLSQPDQYEGASLGYIMANPLGSGFELILLSKPVDFEPTPVPLQPVVPETPEPAPIVLEVTDSPEEITPETEAAPPADQPTSLTSNTVAGNESETHHLFHTVTLRMAFPVTLPSANEYLLKVDFPPARDLQLQLEVPHPDATIVQSKGGILLETVSLETNSTQFVFQGMHSDFELQWYEKQHKSVRERVVLQVEQGRIVANIHSDGVTFDATLPVQSSGGMFDFFQVELPQGAVYRPMSTAEMTDYQIEEIPPAQREEPGEPSKVAAQRIQVRLFQPTEGPVFVRIQAETPISHSQNGWFEVGGFSVVGAEKQFGKLSVIVPLETRLRQQEESPGFRPAIDATIQDATGIVSSYDYFRQPGSLWVQAVPQATRIRLCPEYQVQISRYRAVLRAKLAYTIHGNSNRLAIDMNGWQLTGIGPDNLINQDELPFMETGEITILLKAPVGKKVELDLRAVCDYDSNDGRIGFSFPIPKADFIESAMVAIIPDDNIELNPDADNPTIEMSRKSRLYTPLQIDLPPMRQQGTLIYQLDHSERAKFNAKLALQQRKITVQSQTEVTLQTDEPIKQTLHYTVEYEPITRLILAVPAELDNQGDLRVMCESRLLQQFNMERSDSRDGLVLKQVWLPDARTGTFSLALEFRQNQQIPNDLSKMPLDSTVQLSIPIVLPDDGLLNQETVFVRYPRGLQLNLNEETTGWKKKLTPTSQSPSSRLESVFQTNTATSLLPLGVSLRNTAQTGSTTIEKGWVQCWFLPTGRVNYAGYRVSTNLSHLTMTLPENVPADKITVKVDDRNVEVNRTGRTIIIPLLSPANDASLPTTVLPETTWLDIAENKSQRTLQIRYETPLVSSSNRITLEMPTFASDVLIRSVGCQVIMPGSRHLLACNPEWMPLYRWHFEGGFFSRKPELSQEELHDLIGVISTEQVSPEWNSYIFLSFHPGSDIRLELVDRSTLVLVSSGLILLLGLFLIYFPRTRNPAVLFTLLVLFASAFVYRMTPAILFLQAGVIGFVLVLVATFLYRIFVSSDPWRGLLSGSLSATGLHVSSRFGRRVIPAEDLPSGSSGKRVVPGDSVEESALPTTPDQSDFKRENENAVLGEEANTFFPVSEKDREEP